jgi:hypothetical protein
MGLSSNIGKRAEPSALSGDVHSKNASWRLRTLLLFAAKFFAFVIRTRYVF